MPQRSVEGSRLHLIIPDRMRKQLESACKSTGLNMSELIRRVLDQWLEKEKK